MLLYVLRLQVQKKAEEEEEEHAAQALVVLVSFISCIFVHNIHTYIASSAKKIILQYKVINAVVYISKHFPR